MAILSIDDRFVRFLGIKRDRYVEFEFGIADRDLTVELVLPVELLADFVKSQRVAIQPCDQDLASQIIKLSWDRGAAELLRMMPWCRMDRDWRASDPLCDLEIRKADKYNPPRPYKKGSAA